VFEIPWTGWLLAYTGMVAACAYWHNRQPSKHIVLMALGMTWVALLHLPGTFGDWAGHKELTRYASFLIEDEDAFNSPVDLPRDAGSRLLDWCLGYRWIGWLAFVLGLRRLTKELSTRDTFAAPVLP
jgi:hypothetical protein